jgi:CheY-like chemotaxis protein
LLQHIRHSPTLRNQKIIVSSASVSPQDQQIALEAGGDAFLSKPVDFQVLLDLLVEQLGLTWQYEKCEENHNSQASVASTSSSLENASQPLKEVFLPPVDDLISLLELVECGRLKQFSQQLEALAAENPHYLAFSQPLLVLEKQFQVDAIEALIKDYLNRQA